MHAIYIHFRDYDFLFNPCNDMIEFILRLYMSCQSDLPLYISQIHPFFLQNPL